MEMDRDLLLKKLVDLTRKGKLKNWKRVEAKRDRYAIINVSSAIWLVEVYDEYTVDGPFISFIGPDIGNLTSANPNMVNELVSLLRKLNLRKSKNIGRKLKSLYLAYERENLERGIKLALDSL